MKKFLTVLSITAALVAMKVTAAPLSDAQRLNRAFKACLAAPTGLNSIIGNLGRSKNTSITTISCKGDRAHILFEEIRQNLGCGIHETETCSGNTLSFGEAGTCNRGNGNQYECTIRLDIDHAIGEILATGQQEDALTK